MKKQYWLAVILVVALAVRLVWIEKRPLGFTWDEAALGYNAYSLLLTGRDEYGKAVPIVLKSFGDYKPGLYAYFAVPSIKILGLNETATRVPSAIAGSLLVIAIYLLTRLTTGPKSAWFAAIVAAVNPWAIHFSRGAWEANVSLLLTTLGSVLFLRKKYWLMAILFGLSFWTYQGAKLFTPLILFLLLVLNYGRQKIKHILWPLGLTVIMLIPLVWGLGGQSGRLKVLSVFSYRRSEQVVGEILKQDGLTHPTWWFQLFHFELYDQIRGITQRYLNHFSPYYLFFAGDWSNNRHSIPYMGYFHLPELALLILGIYQLLKKGNRSSWFIWGWLLLAPLPAALSRDIISGVRSLPLLVPLTVIIGAGAAQLSEKKWLGLAFIPVWLFFVAYFGDLYLVHSPFFTSEDWLVAYKPAWQMVKENSNDYQQVVFTDKLGQPYIFGLFYLRIDPHSYQSQAKLAENAQGDVGQVTSFDKYYFRPIYWPTDRDLNSTLFVGGQYELPESDLDQTPNVKRIGVINYPNNTVGLKVVARQ